MKKKTIGYIWWLWGIAAIMSVAVILSVRYFPMLLKSHTNAQSVVGLGEYGDIYGGLNTLFTGLAFVGLVVTILLQRQEMKETREEFEAQTKQFEEQTRLLNEQIEEQKRANEKQFQLAIDAQHKEELFKRLEYVQHLKDEVCLENAYAIWSGIKWTRHEVATFKGEHALILAHLCCDGFFRAINSQKPLSEHEIHQIDEDIDSMYSALDKFTSWLHAFYDYVRDASVFFHHKPDEVSKFLRLVFTPLPPEHRAFLLMFAGTVVSNEYIESIYKGKFISTTFLEDIYLDHRARALVWELLNYEVSIESAQKEWQSYLKQEKKNFVTTPYQVRKLEP